MTKINLQAMIDLLSDEGVQALYDALMDASSREWEHANRYRDDEMNPGAYQYHRERAQELRDGAGYVDSILLARLDREPV